MIAMVRPFLPHIAALAALLAAIWYLDHRGYERARRDAAADAALMENKVRSQLRQTERRLAGRIDAIDRGVADQIAGIDATHRTVIQPTIMKELSRETRYGDPAAGISDGLRTEVNRALQTVACSPTPAGGIVCALPDASPAGEQ